MMNQFRLTREDLDTYSKVSTFFELYIGMKEEGKTEQEIADALGINRKTLWSYNKMIKEFADDWRQNNDKILAKLEISGGN